MSFEDFQGKYKRRLSSGRPQIGDRSSVRPSARWARSNFSTGITTEDASRVPTEKEAGYTTGRIGAFHRMGDLYIMHGERCRFQRTSHAPS